MFEVLDDAAVMIAWKRHAARQNAACGSPVGVAMGELYRRGAAPEDDVRPDQLGHRWPRECGRRGLGGAEHQPGPRGGSVALRDRLRDRLPKVAEVFATGAIDFRMMAELVNRSDNVTDPDVLAKLDAAFAHMRPSG